MLGAMALDSFDQADNKITQPTIFRIFHNCPNHNDVRQFLNETKRIY